MISHVFIGVNDFERALAFYDAVAAALGLERRFLDRARPWAGWKHPDRDRPLLLVGAPYDGAAASVGNGAMLALLAPDRPAVDRAYAAAIAHGGRCDGPPGLRPHYHANYYGAYVRDPDGNKLCFCCHAPA